MTHLLKVTRRYLCFMMNARQVDYNVVKAYDRCGGNSLSVCDAVIT